MTKTIRTAIFDIDGTLALMDKETGTFEALPGAVDALAYCRAHDITPIAYTNGTFFPPAHYYPKLAKAGLVFDDGEILTPSVIAAKALAGLGLTRVMVLGGDGTTVPVQEAGIEVFPAKKTAPKVDAVILGYTRDFGAEDLEAAAEAIWNGATLYAGSVAPYFAGAKGRTLGISGAINAALENATGVKAVVFGKPETAGLEIIGTMTESTPKDMVVIGDDPKLEIKMGRKAGAYCIGVTTGVSDFAKFQSFPEDERAHVVMETLVEFPKVLAAL